MRSEHQTCTHTVSSRATSLLCASRWTSLPTRESARERECPSVERCYSCAVDIYDGARCARCVTRKMLIRWYLHIVRKDASEDSQQRPCDRTTEQKENHVVMLSFLKTNHRAARVSRFCCVLWYGDVDDNVAPLSHIKRDCVSRTRMMCHYNLRIFLLLAAWHSR